MTTTSTLAEDLTTELTADADSITTPSARGGARGGTGKKAAAAPTNDTSSTRQLLPLALIDPDPANRGGLADEDDDVTELAGNIHSVGLLQPLVVRPDGDRYRLIAGHRRRRALLLNGEAAVDCTVLTDLDVDEGEDVVARISENLHRKDLTPLEEAAGFKQLVDLHHSQRAIAALVGCNQSHVSKRLSLLDMPAAAQAAYLADQLTLEDTRALKPLHDHPHALTKVIEAKANWKGYDVAQLVETELRHLENAAEMEAAKQEVTGRGDRWSNATGWDNRFDTGLRNKGVTVAEHRGQPCHAYGWHAGQVIELCTRPANHTPKVNPATGEPVPADGKAAETPAQRKARLAAEKAAAAHAEAKAARLQTLGRALTAKASAKTDKQLLDFLLPQLLEAYIDNAWFRDAETRLVAAMVGKPADDTYSQDSIWDDLASWAVASAANGIRFVTACEAVEAEARQDPSRHDPQPTQAYDALLAALGHTEVTS